MWCDSLAGDPEYMPLSVPAPCTLLALDNNMDTGHGEWRVDSGQVQIVPSEANPKVRNYGEGPY